METLLVLSLSSKIPNACREFSGVTAWELPGFSTKLGKRQNGSEIWAAGWTECFERRVSMHTGNGLMFRDDPVTPRRVWHTAFVHEFIHVAQKCVSPLPVDEFQDEQHSNWTRDGLERIVYDIQSKMEQK